MKNRKVLNVRCHVGAGIQGRLTFMEKDPAGKDADGHMELWPIGVYIPGKELVIPYTNITSLTLAPEAAEPDSEKRGPGRPPGPKAA